MYNKTEKILSINNLYSSYSKSLRGMEYILEDLSLDVAPGECLGIVGESGSGKTTLINLIAGFMKPIKGKILFRGQEIQNMGLKERTKKLDCGIQMIFQDPYSSFHPGQTVGAQLKECLKITQRVSDQEMEEKVYKTLLQIGLSKEHYHRYPHQLSGGQLQRIGIGCAIIVEPCLLLADEPVSSLDVSVEAQILDLIQELKQQLGFSSLFISHDLAVVYYLCDSIAILKNGKIVERGPVEEVFENPQNTYTKKLIHDSGY